MRSCSAVNPEKWFSQSIRRTKSAGIEALNSIVYALPITYYRAHYLRSSTRSRAISETFKRAVETRNAPGRLLSFFCAVAKCGFAGTMVPEDVLAARCVAATGGKMAPRTARAALAELARAGWILKSPTPTGRRIQTATGWATAQIVRVVFTPALNALIRPEAARLPRKKPTSAHNSYPRQNLPTMGFTEKPEPLTKAPVFQTPTIAAAPVDLRQTEEGAHAQRIEQQTLCQTRRKKTRLIGQSCRVSIAKTWTVLRALLLEELHRANATPLQIQIAAAQTDLEYPALFPVALDWNAAVLAMERNARERRRIIRAEILPSLAAFSIGFEPSPDGPETALTLPERRRRDLSRAARAALQTAIGERLDAIPVELLPAAIAERWTSARYTAQIFPILICCGKATTADLTDEEKELFEVVAALTE